MKNTLFRLGVVLIIIGILIPIIPAGIWLNPPTGSMRPAIGDCSVSLYGPATPEEGDVVWYWQEDQPSIIIHRVIDERDNGYLIKGDNVKYADGVIDTDQIHAETYATAETPIPRSTCIDLIRPLYNGYQSMIGSGFTFEDASVDY